jgi:dihydroneopterin aldolase
MQFNIFVRALRIEAEIGCYPQEHGRTQPLIVDVELELEPGPVERLSDTVDYDRVVTAARDIAAAGHIGLVETYASRLAQACLAEPRVTRVNVQVEKPEAVPGAVAGVRLSLSRQV